MKTLFTNRKWKPKLILLDILISKVSSREAFDLSHNVLWRHSERRRSICTHEMLFLVGANESFPLGFVVQNHIYASLMTEHNDAVLVANNKTHNTHGCSLTAAEEGIRASQWNKKGRPAKVQQYRRGLGGFVIEGKSKIRI